MVALWCHKGPLKIAQPWASVLLSVYIGALRVTLSLCRPKACKTAGPDGMQDSLWAVIHNIELQIM